MRKTASVIAAGLTVAANAQCSKDDYKCLFNEFENKYDKKYESEEERKQRYENFVTNYKHIEAENAKDHKYTLGINAFSDLTVDEFSKKHFGFTMPEKQWGGLKNLGTHYYTSEQPLADSIDWRTKGAVTPVKNQGQCGSCWSFSTTGSLEGANQIATGKLVSLSEEMLVDCSKQNHGCGGGSMDLAFQYVEKNGLCTEASYPYIAGGGKAGSCDASSCTKGLAVGAVTGFHDVQANSEQSLMSALMKGPVSIAIEADKPIFQSYKNGVMTGMCGNKLDHGVLTVGYGTLSGTDYWIVKNSWGTVWGMEGYGNLERGKGKSGECGILMAATYPEVSAKPVPPSPGPSPTPPSPTPPSPGKSHYEKPPCESDESAVQIQGLEGSVCAPKCTSSACPTDTPAGTKDTPSCCLQDSSSGDKYCALECGFGGCPPGASCKHPSGSLVGICIYPSSNTTVPAKSAKFVPTKPAPAPAPATSHYEKPPCQSDEVAAQIQGLDGAVCAPKCNSAACPTDTPSGTKDTPSCCLQDSSSGDKYCALECGIAGCPPGAKCAHPSGSLIGICIYPNSNITDAMDVKRLAFKPADQSEVVV